MAYYDTRDMSTLMTQDKLASVSNVFGARKIPIWIWWPIMMCESNGNHNLVFYGSTSNPEHSVGLFQINIRVHGSQYGTESQLKNPTHNAKIAADNFLLPAIRSKNVIGFDSKIPNRKILLQVYSGLINPESTNSGYLSGGGGIKPHWTADLRNKITKYFNYIARRDVNILGSSFVPGLVDPSSQDEFPTNYPGFDFVRGGEQKSTKNLFTKDYTLNEVQESLNKLYNNSPDTIKRRGNRIKETMKNLDIYISEHYMKGE